MNYDLTEYEVEDDIVRQSINNKRRGRRGGATGAPSIAKLRGFTTTRALHARTTGQIGSFRLAVFASTVPLAHDNSLATRTIAHSLAQPLALVLGVTDEPTSDSEVLSASRPRHRRP